METIPVLINESVKYDTVLAGSLPDAGDVTIITKNNATVGGNPAVMIAFTVQMPDGSLHVVQTVTTLKLMLMTLRVLEAAYPHKI